MAMDELDVAGPGGVFTRLTKRHIVNNDYVQAGFLRRAGAFIVDVFISNILFVIGLIMSVGAFFNAVFNDGSIGLAIPGLLLMIASPLVPAVIAGMFGRTPGKMLLGIKTTALDSGPSSGTKLFLRELLKYYIFVVPIAVIFPLGMLLFSIDVLVMLFEKNGQSVHDKIFFNTIVVTTNGA